MPAAPPGIEEIASLVTANRPKALRPDYGLDAPEVVRNLFVAGALGGILWGSAALHLWSGVIGLVWGPSAIRLDLAGSALWPAVSVTAMGFWMVWTSKVGKIRKRESLLDLVAWTGTEQVLDVGCGRGLMMIGAAKRLSTGRAVGIDLWQTVDLSGNRPDAALENARREAVSDRIAIETADMRALPFGDAAFDVIVSLAAIHNIYSTKERRRALHEIARVLRPDGRAIITDIRHHEEYEAAFRERGCVVVRHGSPLVRDLLGIITFGRLRPTTLIVTRPPA